MDSISSYPLVGTYYKGNLGRVQTPTGGFVNIDDSYYRSMVGDARTIITEDGRIFCNDLDEEYMNRLKISIKDIFETIKSQKENSK